MTEMRENRSVWPYFRKDPQKIVLKATSPEEGTSLPPVRIFLGTEESQYRAERIFFYSVKKFRNPARDYEIYLMKNVEGFDRSRWRTGFTNYRYAIPDFAGLEGKAIYNDVDQIYLTDPAQLFDLDLGSHGYLAISAKDTSVMLMDCKIMRTLWNRTTASTLGKHALINGPAKQPGLWGELDPHWNARDQEYREDQTKCLHYTALHQQPWEPFPEAYSYHPNPLGYLWYDLERDADEEGFELFSFEEPSPDFGETLKLAPAYFTARAPGDAARSLMQELQSEKLIEVTSKKTSDEDRISLEDLKNYVAKSGTGLMAGNILLQIPPVDLGWFLRLLFEKSGNFVYLQLETDQPEGLGSFEWWYRRIAEIARHYPSVSWHLDCQDSSQPLPGTLVYKQSRACDHHGNIWILGSPQLSEERRQALGQLRKKLKGTVTFVESGDISDGSDQSFWPGLVLCADPLSEDKAFEMKALSGGRLQIAQIAPSKRAASSFDLIFAGPQTALPSRPNLVHIATDLVPVAATQPDEAGPMLVILGKPSLGFAFSRSDRLAFAKTLAAKAKDKNAPIHLWLEEGLGFPTEELASLEHITIRHGLINPDHCDEALKKDFQHATTLVLPFGQPRWISLAAGAGKNLFLIEQERSFDRLPLGKPVSRILTLAAGGGHSYRGTPHQQHFLARMLDEWRVRGRVPQIRRYQNLYTSLLSRGLASVFGKEHFVTTPKPLRDLDKVARYLEGLMAADVRQGQQRD